MDHLAEVTKTDPLAFRKKNFVPDGENASIAMTAFDISGASCRCKN